MCVCVLHFHGITVTIAYYVNRGVRSCVLSTDWIPYKGFSFFATISTFQGRRSPGGGGGALQFTL